ncbi:MAG: hypothetical protein ACR2J1_09580 [Methyloceanibacter sp.]|uniref:hypothetical protein n=1 Tax=Methyloceanibacter sp. TaxID=1965321 RepID=UPI003D9BC8D7
MRSKRFLAVGALAASFASVQFAAAQSQDAQLCFDMSDRVRDGETLADVAKRAAHDACLRALAATSNVVQKYHLQEADFDIMGTRPKN